MIGAYQSLIKKEKGAVHRLEDWGPLPIKLPIRKLHKAHYVLMNITCNQAVLDEFAHSFRFSDAILRHLVISRDKPITEPSPRLKVKDASRKSSVSRT